MNECKTCGGRGTVPNEHHSLPHRIPCPECNAPSEQRIHVFLVENEDVAREMIEQHFKGTGAITFASIHGTEERPALVEAINNIG